ncbi:MAG: lytic murein transglycosylase [Patescibacteria group bacterium]
MNKYGTYSFFILFALILNTQVAFSQSACLDSTGLDNMSDEKLNELLEQCEAEIAQEQERLKATKAQTQSRERDLALSEQSIRKSETFIQSRNLEIRKIKSRINDQEEQIQKVESKAERIQQSIAQLIRQKDRLDSYSVVEAVFSEDTLSGFFGSINDYESIRTKLVADFDAYNKLKDQIMEEQAELSEEQSRQRELALQKELEKTRLEKKRAEQKVLRDLSKEQEKAYQKLIEEKEAAKRALRARLFTTASGEKVSFGEAYDIISPYESALGVDSAFVLAVLFQESGWGGEIGGNIGACTYNQYNPHGGRNGNDVMAKSQQDNFLALMSDLGRDPNKQKVSCPIPTDGAYGGAMGPAQFMPNTWMDVRTQAARYLGVDPDRMSPFVNRDAFVASATYLRNHYYSSSCANYAEKYSHIRSKESLREKCAAARYYAGGNWWNFRNTYGESVQNRASRFRHDIETLEN